MFATNTPFVQHVAPLLAKQFQTLPVGPALCLSTYIPAIIISGVISGHATIGSTWHPPADLRLRSIETDGLIFRLSRELQLTVSFVDEVGWFCDYPSLGIFAIGDSPDGAFRSFASEFAVLWEELASLDDDALTGDAIAVKQLLRGLVTSAERAN